MQDKLLSTLAAIFSYHLLYFCAERMPTLCGWGNIVYNLHMYLSREGFTWCPNGCLHGSMILQLVQKLMLPDFPTLYLSAILSFCLRLSN